MQLTRRDELGDFLNELGLTGTGAEVGVLAGEFAATVLRRWAGTKLYLVDPWRPQPGADYLDIHNHPEPAAFDRAYRRVLEMARADPRAAPIRAASPAAARHFPDGSLDWVYLDGNHRYLAVRADLAAWWPKVRPGGLLAGHDYLDGYVPGRPDWQAGTLFGVRTAVNQFARSVGRCPAYTTADGPFPSWYVRKPLGEPPSPERITVVSAHTPGAYDRVGEVARANHAAYCARHGYRHVHRTDGFDPARPPAWSKLRFVREALEEADWALWIDADALFMDWTCRLEWLAEDRFDLVVGRDRLNGINTGVFLARGSAWAGEFLARADGMREFTAHPLWENAAVLRLEATDGEARRRLWAVPQRLLNSYPHYALSQPGLDAWGPGDFVAHFAGFRGREAAVADFAAMAEAANGRG